MEKPKLKFAKLNLSELTPIQKRAIVNCSYFVATIVVYIVTQLLLGSINSSLAAEVKALGKQNSQHQLTKANLSEEVRQIKHAEKLWQQVRSQEAQYGGLQLDNARKVLAKLEDKYVFYGPVEVSLSPINETDSLYDLVPNYQRNVAIVSTTMKLVIKAFEDTEIVGFVNDLLSSLPGYAQVTKWTISRKTDISEEAIKGINSGNGNWFFNSEIYLEWQDLKDLEATKASKGGEV